MRASFFRIAVSLTVAVCLMVTVVPAPGVAQEPPSAEPPGEVASPPALPSPSPDAAALPPSVRAGATFLGKTATGAPVRLDVAPDGRSLVWFEIGDAEAVKNMNPAIRSILESRLSKGSVVIESPDTIMSLNSIPVLTFDQSCGTAHQRMGALWLKTGRDVPIIADSFVDDGGYLLTGTFEGDSARGTISAAMKPDDPPCVTTTWEARVTR